MLRALLRSAPASKNMFQLEAPNGSHVDGFKHLSYGCDKLRLRHLFRGHASAVDCSVKIRARSEALAAYVLPSFASTTA